MHIGVSNVLRFWGVFTVDASSQGNAQQSFIAIAKACGTDPNERAAKSWLSSIDRPWLLLIDNADDTNLDVEKYFPDGDHGLTLITTRNPSVKIHGTIGRRFYHFDKLDDDEASELLLRAAEQNEPWTTTTMQLATAITRKLGALPLALVHAGKAIKAKYCQLSNYIPFYERSWQIIRQNQHTTGQEEDDAEYMEVYASYEIVFRGLEAIRSQRYRDAVQLLKIFSFLHHEHIPFDALIAAAKNPRKQRDADVQEAKNLSTQVSDSSTPGYQPFSWPKRLLGAFEYIIRKQFELQNPMVLPTFLRDAELCHTTDECEIRLREALHLLTQLSLITHHEFSDSYSMHPLVHTWVRERPQMTIREQAIWCEAALHTISRCILLPPQNELVDPDGNLARKLLPHVISIRKYQQKIEKNFADNRCNRIMPWPVLEPRLIPWRAMFLAKSALVYFECGDFVETEKCLRTVMHFNRKFLGSHHPRTEKVILAVSDCLWQQCRVNDAADLQEQVLNDNLRNLGPSHPRTLRIMDRLGESRRQQGRFAESIELLTKASDGMKTQLPDTDPATYHALEQLGITLRACFRFEDARQYQEKAVEGMKKALGGTDTRTIIAIEELAITYKDLSTAYTISNKSLAREYIEAAHRHACFVVEQRRKQLGDRQPLTWMAQGTLGRIQATMGDVSEAERLFSFILPIAARHLGDDHLGVLSHKSHYSTFLIQQKRYHEAENFLLDISRPAKYRTTASTGDHPDRWNALWTLVDCYEKQSKIEESLTTCDELLEAVRAIQEGKQQTEISRTFWQMVLDKRAELLAIRASGTAKDSTPVLLGSPANFDPAALHPRIKPISHDTEISPINEAGMLRIRGVTW